MLLIVGTGLPGTITWVVSVWLLLLGKASFAGDDAVPVLLMLPTWLGVALIVMVALALAANVPKLQRKVVAVGKLHVPCEVVTWPKTNVLAKLCS